MKKYKHYFDFRPEIILMLLFFSAFIVGMILSFVSRGETADGKQWLNTSLLYLRYGEINYIDVLFYILKKRLSVILLLLLICMTGKGRVILPLGGAIAGAFGGFYITEFICLKGILGSALFLVTIFPHYICYAYGYYSLVKILSNNKNKSIDINRHGQYGGLPAGKNNVHLIKKYLPIAVVIMGIVLECYVNPFFVKIFLKFFI